jgi:hypothetical protein
VFCPKFDQFRFRDNMHTGSLYRHGMLSKQ